MARPPAEHEPLAGDAGATLAGAELPTADGGGGITAAPVRLRNAPGLAFWIAVVWLAAVVFGAVASNELHLADPHAPLAGPPLAGLSLHHPFGTDVLGHDLFSQVVHGARVSLLVAVVSVAVGLLVGGNLGIVAGYLGGKPDEAVMWLTDVVLAFPGLVFVLALVSFLGASLTNVVLAIAVLSIPAYVRIARAGTLVFAQQEFVVAAQALGAGPTRVMWRELLPNVAVPLIPYTALGAGVAIIAEGGLAFLGLSAPNSLSWGSMIAQGQAELQQAPQAAMAPMLAMFLTIVALNIVGQRMGASLDPRSSNL